MPIIKSAIKKVRKDKNRTARNEKREAVLKTLVKKARKDNTPAVLSRAFSALDKAVKVNLIHKNKASRLKSRLSKNNAQPSSASESKASRLKSRLSKGSASSTPTAKKASAKKSSTKKR